MSIIISALTLIRNSKRYFSNNFLTHLSNYRNMLSCKLNVRTSTKRAKKAIIIGKIIPGNGFKRKVNQSIFI